MPETPDLVLNRCIVCGQPAELVERGWAQPRYLVRCQASIHYDPVTSKDHTAAGTTAAEAQARWNHDNPPADTSEEGRS